MLACLCWALTVRLLCQDVPVNSEAALAKAVANQPISVAICASPALQFYTGGAWAALADSISGAGWLLEAECVSHAAGTKCKRVW